MNDAKICVTSPHAMLRDALEEVVVALGFDVGCDADSRIVLRDLTSAAPPFPAPDHLPTLAVVRHDGPELIELLRQGYRGYLRRSDGRYVLERALQALLRGESWIQRHVMSDLIEGSRTTSLTPREQEVYQLLIAGYANPEIAASLGIAVNTVKLYVSRVYDKLGVRNRNVLIAMARQQSKQPS